MDEFVESVLSNDSVKRVTHALQSVGITGEITILEESARSAAEAANALGIEVGQVASSIVFRLPDGQPLLVITSGRHRVDTHLVASNLGIGKLERADAEFVKTVSGFSIGGVSPFGWISQPLIVIDSALDDYEIVWAAAGHPHAVFPTTFAALCSSTGGKSMIVGA